MISQPFSTSSDEYQSSISIYLVPFTTHFIICSFHVIRLKARINDYFFMIPYFFFSCHWELENNLTQILTLSNNENDDTFSEMPFETTTEFVDEITTSISDTENYDYDTIGNFSNFHTTSELLCFFDALLCPKNDTSEIPLKVIYF